MKKWLALVCLIFTFSFALAAPIGQRSEEGKAINKENFVQKEFKVTFDYAIVKTVPEISGNFIKFEKAHIYDVGVLATDKKDKKLHYFSSNPVVLNLLNVRDIRVSNKWYRYNSKEPEKNKPTQ